MLLFTWNLKKNDVAFRLALAHLHNSGQAFIACLQELPSSVATTALARNAVHNLVGNAISCLGVTPAASPHKHGRVALLCSPGLSSTMTGVQRDPRQRMAIIPVRGTSIGQLLAIGYHGISRQDASSLEERGAIGAQIRGEINKHWLSGQLIMLGDFNANPFDAEVCGSGGLYAVRSKLEVMKTRASPLLPLGTKQRLLYNPMWPLLPERLGQPEGTIVFKPNTMLRWRLYDQILLSSGLVTYVQGLPQILSFISKKPLLKADGTPDKDISDHLPVQLCINI
jgi:hypothetical protein